MNTLPRRVVLSLTIVLGLFVGVWASFFPHSFYDDFPGFGLHWVRRYGAFDEHLVSDVGSAYLAFAGVSLAGMVARRAAMGRAAGVVWTVFGVLHLAFHAFHLMGSLTDRVGNVLGLVVSLLLGSALIALPVRAARPDRGEA